MPVDPIGASRLVAQYGGAATPRGTSDAAAAQAGSESQFERLRRERAAAAESTIRAVKQTEAAERNVIRQDGEPKGQGGGRGRQKDEDESDADGDTERGRHVDYSA
jgi:hypothetical protein